MKNKTENMLYQQKIDSELQQQVYQHNTYCIFVLESNFFRILEEYKCDFPLFFFNSPCHISLAIRHIHTLLSHTLLSHRLLSHSLSTTSEIVVSPCSDEEDYKLYMPISLGLQVLLFPSIFSVVTTLSNFPNLMHQKM